MFFCQPARLLVFCYNVFMSIYIGFCSGGGGAQVPSKHKTLKQWWLNVGPPVSDAGPTNMHNCFNVLCLLGIAACRCDRLKQVNETGLNIDNSYNYFTLHIQRVFTNIVPEFGNGWWSRLRDPPSLVSPVSLSLLLTLTDSSVYNPPCTLKTQN